MDDQSYSILNEKVDKQVLLTKRKQDGKMLIAKVLRQEFPDEIKLHQLENEYKITNSLDTTFVRKAISREMIQNRHALILEYFEGTTLFDAFVVRKQPLESFLKVAMQITQALAYLHQQKIIHKDINSSNILVNLSKPEIKIIDFEMSSRADSKKSFTGNVELLEGSLAYMSPEQTGRMNRKVDYRSDLYSLGITFYELLTGTLPFSSMDALEMVHMHIAKRPVLPQEINPLVPTVIGNIVLKLLSKNAEDRYQSALGVYKDLERCLRHLSSQGVIPDFSIAAGDFSGALHLSQKLYGREQDVNTIIDSFSRISNGNTEIILVEGSPGIGKSALVHELHRPVTEKHGFFIEGKFEQYQRNIPFFAFIQAFEELVTMLLTESESKLAYWKNKIQEAVGSLGKVITDLVPSLELIIDKQADVPELGATESQNRLIYVILNFINVFCKQDHPFVLFIDDLQWADSGSLLLLSRMRNNREKGFFLLIGAYRDNELHSAHPLVHTLESIRSTEMIQTTIKLKNLSQKDILCLITDTLKSANEDIEKLAFLISSKTQGNPFFIGQFLKLLYEDDLLNFDFATSRWNWNEKATRELDSTNNVIDLLVSRIQKLPVPARETLMCAACIGTRFDLDTLSVLLNKSAAEVGKDILPCLLDGLIVAADHELLISDISDYHFLQQLKHLRFVHDRIQQAAYSLIAQDQREQVHFEIGKLLLKHLDSEQLDEKIFDVVYHLNKGNKLIENEDERINYAVLNAQAAAKAKKSSAFKPAFEFYTIAIKLAGKNDWDTSYQLLLDLYTEGAETAYLIGEFDTMNDWLSQVFRHAASVLDTVKAYNVKIDAETSVNELPKALETGLEILEKLGVNFPRNPKLPYIFYSLILTQTKLNNQKIEKLIDLQTMTNAEKLEAMFILQRLIPAAFMSGSQLFPLIVFKMVRLSLQFGNSEPSALGYASFAITQTGILGNFEIGARLGKASLQVLDKFSSDKYRVKVLFTLNNFIRHWKEHLRLTVDPLLESFQLGLKVGDLVGGTWSAYYRLLNMFFYGKELPLLQAKVVKYSGIFEQYKQEAALKRTNMLHQVILNLMGRNTSTMLLTGSIYNENDILRIIEEGNDQTSVFCFYQNKAFLSYLFGDYLEAREFSQKAMPFISSVTGLPELTTFIFYDTLISISAYNLLSSAEQGAALSRIKKNRNKLSKWAKSGAENYLHKLLLVDAAYCLLKKEAPHASVLFDKAGMTARKNEYIQEEALVYERAGEFYFEQENSNLGEYYLIKSYDAYRHWGASAKMRQLENKYPFILFTESRETELGIQFSHSGKTDNLDLASVLKASTAISSEIVFDRFVEKLMRIAIENAGAQRGVLLLNYSGSLKAEVEGLIYNNEIICKKADKTETGLYLPQSLVQYVSRSRESIVIEDISSDSRFLHDPVIIKNKTGSVLCFPIINLGNLIGVLYLENNLVKGAFTSLRIEVLKLLSGQMSVSIQNSLLFENLEEKVKERTKVIADQKDEIEKERQKSENLLLEILPLKTAQELKLFGHAQPRLYNQVTVMFADFVGFSKISKTISPEKLVKAIDYYYRNFDRIILENNLEKIKTIGDCYMCAGGLPEENHTHAYNMIQAAKAIQEFVRKEKAERLLTNEPFFENRIGIHTGPVVAGIVGLRKFAYDVWGDTVNIAARLEETSQIGRINVSTSTYELLKAEFVFNYRGKIEVKNLGEIDMYFLEDAIPEVSMALLT
ncbi:adenylate/guanylate cyclase domain-containing protein [Dyadobacter sediminis]|nr:adenylate/guanylate cyclase domain-containing protein [Dyadobacter sediminis]